MQYDVSEISNSTVNLDSLDDKFTCIAEVTRSLFRKWRRDI